MMTIDILLMDKPTFSFSEVLKMEIGNIIIEPKAFAQEKTLLTRNQRQLEVD